MPHPNASLQPQLEWHKPHQQTPLPSLAELWANGMRVPGRRESLALAQPDLELTNQFRDHTIGPIDPSNGSPTRCNYVYKQYRARHTPYPSATRQRLAPLNFEQVRELGPARSDRTASLLATKLVPCIPPEHADCAEPLAPEVFVPAVDMDAMRVEIPGEHTKWLEYAAELGKVEGKGNPVYQCLHENVNQKEVTLCTFRGLKQTVKRHINATHFGIRPWVCSECSKAFPQKSALKIHVNAMHVWTIQYGCLHCPLAFKDPAARHRHIVKDHRDKPIRARKKAPYADVPIL